MNENSPGRDAAAPDGKSGRAKLSRISVLVPIKDEEASVRQLVAEIVATCSEAKIEIAEILFVDDGSTDNSWPTICELAKSDARIKGLRLRRNFGKATALSQGARETTGDIIITMDGDLQDLPKEIPRFLAKLDEGYDLVSGWKQLRHDPLDKTLPSLLFNKMTAAISGVRLHDFNCGFKAYRREILDSIRLYGELHRFVPVLADGYGFRIGEIAVEHRPRRHGVSKYGTGRLLKGMLDLFTVVMLTRFQMRPSHLLGGIGLAILAVGTLILAYLTLLKLMTGVSIGTRPLLMLGVLLAVVGVQLLVFGLLAELVASFGIRLLNSPDLARERVGKNKA